MPLINIKIDGRSYQVVDGMTILQAAKVCGYEIPSLCTYHNGECNVGSCRVCLVEVKAKDKWVGKSMKELDFLQLNSYERDLQGYINNWTWDVFLARWCGFAPEMANPEDVMSRPEVESMPAYPADGSILVLEDVVVVKF